ncbi:MAG TPA: TM2 domain-containing protein [Flavobacteriales bacterium]|nr:TM2 domain-containing protein [Flavobacteriales bacterium]HIN40545.1 TM2 domain-containing protein [Flavobacteriales bacterium]
MYPFNYECWNCNKVFGSEKSLGIKKTKKNIFLSDKSFVITLLLCIFLGLYGGHRFYTGKASMALLMLFTVGGCGIWWIIDFLILITGNFQDDDELFITPHWYGCCPKCSCLNIRLKKI